MTWVAVMLGSALGGLLRFFLSTTFVRAAPWTTLGINVLGSFLLGYLSTRAEIPATVRFGLTAGFCGGFTTFSAFSLEALLLSQRNSALSLLYIGGSVLASILALWAGCALAKEH